MRLLPTQEKCEHLLVRSRGAAGNIPPLARASFASPISAGPHRYRHTLVLACVTVRQPTSCWSVAEWSSVALFKVDS